MQQTNIAIGVRHPSAQAAVLDIEGEMTAAAEAALMEAYDQVNPAAVRVVVLNFDGLEYMNSSGIGLLVTLLVRVNRNHQRLVATGLNEHYQQIFEVTRLTEAIVIYESEPDALAAAAA